ncbi:sulfate transporter N-terminal domain with GLY motif-domain-containing protein [Obelidium mucronatum]|nr:sulfate transporter N-terminal domain with GLY motif-domain-containing protein [Obelidium mucronatum]
MNPNRDPENALASSQNSVQIVPRTAFDVVSQLIPPLVWGRNYSLKDNFLNDLMAGLTLSTLVIPQAMAYAVMTSLPPVYGLYTAIFPPLVFFFFAPSPFQNIGPYAVVSVMVSQVATSALLMLGPAITPFTTLDSNTTAVTSELLSNGIPAALQIEYADIVMFLTFSVGLIQFLVCILGLGAHALVSGFMASSGICVLVSQLKSIFGLSIPQYDGPLSLILTFIAVVKKLPQTNWCAFGLAVGAYISILLIQSVEKVLKTQLPLWWNKNSGDSSFGVRDRRKKVVAVSDVILTVLLAAFVTFTFDLPGLYGVKTIGFIPSGFPSPRLPWEILSTLPNDRIGSFLVEIFPGTVSLALVCFVTTYSITKTFELKTEAAIARISTTFRSSPSSVEAKIKTDSQDLLALSLATLVSSFFSSYVPSGSISRSALLANQTSVTTPVGSLIATICVAIILLFLGSWFQYVPLSSLGTIVVVALFGVLSKVKAGYTLILEARDKGRQVKEAMKVVETEASAMESGALASNGAPVGVAENASTEESTCTRENNPDNINDPDAITPTKFSPDQASQQTAASEIVATNAKVELYLLWLKFVSIHRDVGVWWITFLAVIVLDAGSGILVGMLLSCLFLVVDWGHDSMRSMYQ